ncbi:MAG: branched-chain amino acid ABC transporter permease [Chloroflexi bacterium]|nr:branched-chain amino acid ABC transporter permease [Chloroflexota bacterium]
MSEAIRPAGVFDTRYEEDIALNRTRGEHATSLGSFLLLMCLPLISAAGPLGLNWFPLHWIGTINHIAILTIAVQGLNLLIGYCGQISFGQAAFMAVGGYTSALLGIHWGIPFWIALPLAAAFTGFIGILFGLPALRVKGFYLAMSTLAAQFILIWFIHFPLEGLTNGSRALTRIPPPTLGPTIREVQALPVVGPQNLQFVAQRGPITFSSAAEMYYIIVPLTVFLMLAARNIRRTRTGRAFISIRDNDLAAELLGINVFYYKLQAFFLCSVYAGIAGALMAYHQNSLSITSFMLDHSIIYLAMLVIGGAGFPLGPIFGVTIVQTLTIIIIPAIAPGIGAFLRWLLPFVQSANLSSALTLLLRGGILLAFLLFEPRGVAHRWEILKISWKLRPFSHE